ncbi:NAD(P)H-hydrate dehydratase [Peptococcaceae bacterium 1198_IL3148]
MQLVTAEEMRAIDGKAIAEYGIPGIVLMENAGKAVVNAVVRQLQGNVRGKAITIFVGKGNNGGDGLVVARHLLNMGADVRVLMITEPEGLTGDAQTNLNIWRNMGQKIYLVHQPNGINLVKISLLSTDLIVDAMFGTGFKGTVGEKIGRIIELINTSDLPIVAVDIPSGLEADTSNIGGHCVKASVTVTFGLPKLGMVLESGAAVCGMLEVADISLPKPLLTTNITKYLLDLETVANWLPQRNPWGHKGNFGRVLVVGGSKGMAGAAILTATAALKTGAGLVTLAVPASIHDTVAGKIPEIMTLSLPDAAGRVTTDALEMIKEQMANVDVLAVGPGLSQHLETVKFIQQLLPQVEVPTIVDADGINALAHNTEIFEQINVPLVITPHPGELARLLDATIAEVQGQRFYLAQQCAESWDCTVLLKGPRTLVAEPKGTVYINPTGNQGMATAGSGDVLTGIIAGLMAQGLDVTKAAATAAYLHGMAGDQGAEHLGSHSLMAGDILGYLPQCFQKVARK